MPRYVILEHSASPRTRGQTHWDLMLESDGRLRTWALAAPPTTAAQIPAEQLPDHRLAYLDFEGPLSGDRGQVHRWTQGTYQIEAESTGEIRLHFHGPLLHGPARLQRAAASLTDAQRWTFSFDSA